MEFEIINSILTNTVASLFPNKSKHLKFFQTFQPTERSTDKADIPKSSNRKNSGNITNTSNTAISTSFNINNPIVNNNSNIEEEKSNTKKEVTIENWASEIKDNLKNIMSKLNLNNSKTTVKYLISLSLDEIEVEKSKIKKELQDIDKEFEKLFKRPPSKPEKEVLRPLYVYYNDIKNIISKKRKAGETLKTKDTSNNRDNNSNNKIQDTKIISQQQNNKIVNINSSDNNKRPQSSSHTANQSNSNSNKEKEMGIDEVIKKRRPNSAKMKNYDNYKLEDLKTEISKIKNQQLHYKQKLHEYQKEFLRKNNRRVKYYKDIEEVEFEYVAYKENRALLEELEEAIKKCNEKQ